MHDDERWMRRALELAAQGRASTSPNPMVGCVIVRDGRLLAEGFHRRAGLPHAEVEAINAAGGNVEGATVYVTLEPCSHTGRTPPCADALIAAGVARVVVAIEDPNPQVNGAGLTRLREKGIAVESGLLAPEAAALNEKFLFSVTRQRPFVLLKAGVTLDGKLATAAGESRWITSPDSRQKSLELREEYDAIMAGSGTIVADDPALTRRLGLAAGITPWLRVIVDGRGEIPVTAKLFTDGGRTLLFTSFPARYDGLPIDVVASEARDGKIDLEEILQELDHRGIRSVIVEGGSLLHSDFIARRLWQKLTLFVAPMVVGGAAAPSIFGGPAVERLTEAHRFRFDAAERVGPDLMITAYRET